MMHPQLISDGGFSESAPWKTERLDSWKAVASFFRREVRTVQLWEKNEGLPVRRQHHKKLGSVYAYRTELEQWWTARSAMSVRGGNAAAEPRPSPREATLPSADPLAAGTPHLLVLPFDAIHSTTDRESMRQAVHSFADGLRDDLIVELSRLKLHPTSIPVKAMPSRGTSTLTFMKTLAAEFAADLLLAGTIRIAGTQIRVSAQLIRAGDLRCLWSDRFDVGLTELLDTQEALACRIGQALADHTVHRAVGSKHDPVARHGLAHHACMVANHFWNQRNRESMQKAFGYFKDAVELDPQYADAHAGLANTYVSLSYNHLMPARLAGIRAHEAVETGLKLDPDSVAVRNARINVLINCTWDSSTAEQECKDLIDSGLMDSRTIQLYSSLMGAQGSHDEAIDLALHGQRLEPLSAAANTQVSQAYFYRGDYDSALPFIRRAIELTPRYTMGQALLGRIEAERGNWDEAVAAFGQTLEFSNHSPFAKALLAYAHAGSGDAPKATAVLSDLDDASGDECFPAYDVSAAHSMLDQEEEALRNIYRAYDARDMKTIFLKQDPRFARLRNSPGFSEIASSISFS